MIPTFNDGTCAARTRSANCPVDRTVAIRLDQRHPPALRRISVSSRKIRSKNVSAIRGENALLYWFGLRRLNEDCRDMPPVKRGRADYVIHQGRPMLSFHMVTRGRARTGGFGV